MANPDTPAQATFPIPPPLPGLPITDPKSGRPTQQHFSFLQALWAAIQGGGGIIEIITIMENNSIVGIVDAIQDQLGSLAALIATIREESTGDASGLSNAVQAAIHGMADLQAQIDSLGSQPGVAGLINNMAFQDAARVAIKGGTAILDWTATIPVIVADLPTGFNGQRAFVTDATATTFHSVVAGTGANNVPVFFDGTNWRIG